MSKAQTMVVVAFAGLARAGKTTLANELAASCQRHDVTCQVMSFAQPLKEAAAACGITKDKHPELYRKALQYLGTDLVRAEHPDWWVDRMGDRLIEAELRGVRVAIIDDLRFPNELQMVADWKPSRVYLVDAHARLGVDLASPSGCYAHPSERLAAELTMAGSSEHLAVLDNNTSSPSRAKRIEMAERAMGWVGRHLWGAST